MKNLEKKTLSTQILLITITFVLLLLMWNHLPLSDKESYFDFADTRTLWHIPNAGDVLSNIPFLLLGMMGLKGLLSPRSSKAQLSFPYHLGFALLSLGSLLTCLGSMYFHLTPNVITLFWDRLPMTVGFTALIGLLITDRMGEKIGLYSAYVLVASGLVTVIGWHLSWFSLRPYLCLQYGCLIFALVTVAITPSNFLKNSHILLSLFFYILAKLTELTDRTIFEKVEFISGHTLKHLLAAVAIWIILKPVIRSIDSIIPKPK